MIMEPFVIIALLYFSVFCFCVLAVLFDHYGILDLVYVSIEPSVSFTFEYTFNLLFAIVEVFLYCCDYLYNIVSFFLNPSTSSKQ